MTTIFAQRSRWLSVAAGVLVMAIVVAACVMIPRHHQVLGQAPDWSLRHILPVADQFNINRVSGGVEYTVAYLPSGQNRKMFTLLKRSGRFHSAPPREKPDFVFDIPFGAGAPYHSSSGPHSCPTFDYVSKTGELGSGHDWCYVPPQFKLWMQSLKARTPPRNFQVETTSHYTSVREIRPQKTD